MVVLVALVRRSVQPAALRLTGELNLEALRNAFSELVKRHEILRTTFVTTDGEPALQISELAGFTFATGGRGGSVTSFSVSTGLGASAGGKD
jgi:hypothetical protein